MKEEKIIKLLDAKRLVINTLDNKVLKVDGYEGVGIDQYAVAYCKEGTYVKVKPDRYINSFYLSRYYKNLWR